MANIMKLMPELIGEELDYIQSLSDSMDEEQAQVFVNSYRAQRKDPNHILLMACIGFLGVSGVHRFVMGQIGMGVLYLLTGGLCAIGTIVDIVNHKKLAWELNQEVAFELSGNVKSHS